MGTSFLIFYPYESFVVRWTTLGRATELPKKNRIVRRENELRRASDSSSQLQTRMHFMLSKRIFSPFRQYS